MVLDDFGSDVFQQSIQEAKTDIGVPWRHIILVALFLGCDRNLEECFTGLENLRLRTWTSRGMSEIR